MPFLGIDISGNNADSLTLPAIKDTKNQFVIVKASEGQRTTFASYATQMAAVRAAGKLAGAYHFAWPNQDPAVEAANFVAAAGLQPGDLAVVDMERQTAGESWATRVAYALAWCDAVKAATGATPLVYVNWSWIKGMRTAATATQWARLTKYPCWLADYSGVAGQHSTINGQGGTSDGGWPIAMHQYLVDSLDRDYFELDLAAWTALAVPTKEPFTVGQYDDIMAKLATLTTSVSAVGTKVDTLSTKSASEHASLATTLAGVASAAAVDSIRQKVDDLAAELGNLPVDVREQVAQSVTAALGGFQINVTYPTKE